jgi:hypothetical protein
LRFTGRTKGAARLVDGKIQGQPIDADVEKRSDAGAKNEGEDAEQEVVIHLSGEHAMEYWSGGVME